MKTHRKLTVVVSFFSFFFWFSTDASADNFTIAEVGKHSSRSDCWIIVDDKVYDVTSYIYQHPASPNLIIDRCGKDATEAWKTKGGVGRPHSSRATTELERHVKGAIIREPAATRSP